MSKIKVSKKVLKRAKDIVEAEIVEDTKYEGQSLPVVQFWYPLHGEGAEISRVVRMVSMDSTHVQGFELRDAFDQNVGVFKKYSLNLMGEEGVRVLYMPHTIG